jgi:hypothetical protein
VCDGDVAMSYAPAVIEEDLEFEDVTPGVVAGMDDPERVATQLAATLAAQNNRWVPEVAHGDDGPSVRLTQPTLRPIDLSSIESSQVVRLEVVTVGNGVNTITLVGLPAGAVLQLSITGDRAERDVRELVVSDMAGDLELLRLVTSVGIRVGDGVTGRVTLGTGVMATTVEGAAQPVFRLSGGHLVLKENVNRLCLAGEGTVSTTVQRGARIRHLEVESDSTLLFDDPRQVAVGKAEPAAGVNMPSLALGVPERPARAVRDRRNIVVLNHVKLVRLTTSGVANVHCTSIRDSILQAPLKLELVGAAEVFNTRFEINGDDWVELSGPGGATVLNASGQVELHDVRSLQMTGAPEGLQIRDHGSVGTPSDASWEDTVLTGVRLPAGLAGRRMLTLAGSAYHFTPDTTDLPGRDQTFLGWLFNRDGRTNYKGPENARRLLADAEYVRELARVCRDKGSPGSVATQTAWCAYRLRALKAKGVEWVALGAYRLIGYGERPVPAFLLWFALAILFAGPVLWAGGHETEWSIRGAEVFASEVGRLLLGPLSGLTRSGGTLDSGGDFAEVAARTLTAIPLITGGIALRNYVKSER